MGIDTFPPWVPKVRKDPLGFASYNRLLARFEWVQALFATEHLIQAVGDSTAGEHNAAEIPREVGSCFITAGPTGNLEGFRYAIAAARTAAGTMHLTLDNAPYVNVNQMALQVQNCSEAGINKPSTTSAIIIDTGQIEFYSKTLTSALGAANAWGNDDANFCVAIHGPPLSINWALSEGIAKNKGDYLSDTVLDWNAQVQGDTDLRSVFLADGIGTTHDASGHHTCREVARTYADISVRAGGGAYVINSSSPRNTCASATRVGLGHVQLTFTNAITLSAQVFVTASYQVLNGGTPSDTYVACTPRSQIFPGSSTTVDVYLYKYDFTAKTWARADTDFFITVYGG